ncbi:MAG: AAA family ATPase [Syntrophobacteraceae bacterium]
MRISFIEIAGFRGFKDKTRFELPGGFVVLTGRNGTGKSTVMDAVDFVLTGTINKYAVKGAKGGGLQDHIWWVGEGVSERQYVSVGLVDEGGKESIITRSRERGLDTPEDEIASVLCHTDSCPREWAVTLMQTTLIRDEMIAGLSLDMPEQARFAAVRAAIGSLAGPDHSKRTGALLTTASTWKEAQIRRVVSAQDDLGRVLGSLTEARSIAEKQADVAEAGQIIASLAPHLAGVPGVRTEMLRRHIADRKQSVSILAEALKRSEFMQAERLYFQSEAGLAEIATTRADHANALQAKELAAKSFMVARQLDSAELESDAFASHMVALLAHGEALGLQNGHCPLCNALRSSEEFVAVIAATRSKLSARTDGATRAAAGLKEARLILDQTEVVLDAAEQRLRGVEARQNALARETENVESMLAQCQIAGSASDPENLRQLLFRRQEETAQLEHALFTLEVSSAHDRVTAIESRIGELRVQINDETAKLAAVERAVDLARQIDHAAKEVPNQVLTEQFDTVMPLLKELYLRLRPHADWREIETDFGGRVRASLNFTVGDGRNPQFLFSSGQRRATGIAFLLAIHLSRPWCRLRSLLLDDPVQHIDDFRALNLVEVLSAVRRTGRQLIISVEDPALADVLCRRLRSTALQAGRRFELCIARNGSSSIERQVDIVPLPREILKIA